MRKTNPGCALLLLGIAVAGSAHAQWKWRDAAGQINYSDQPPPSSVPASSIISLRGAPLPAAPGAQHAREGLAPTASAAQTAAAARATDATAQAAALEGASAQGAASAAPKPAAAGASAQPVAAAQRPRSAAERLNELRKQQAEKEAAQRKGREQQQLEARVAQWCEDLRARERMLESGMRVARVDQAGEQSFMTDEERASQLGAIRKDLQAQCSAGT